MNELQLAAEPPGHPGKVVLEPMRRAVIGFVEHTETMLARHASVPFLISRTGVPSAAQLTRAGGDTVLVLHGDVDTWKYVGVSGAARTRSGAPGGGDR